VIYQEPGMALPSDDAAWCAKSRRFQGTTAQTPKLCRHRTVRELLETIFLLMPTEFILPIPIN